MEAFVPGKTTREDVLLRLGQPERRSKDDHILVYHWALVVGAYGGAAGPITVSGTLIRNGLKF